MYSNIKIILINTKLLRTFTLEKSSTIYFTLEKVLLNLLVVIIEYIS